MTRYSLRKRIFILKTYIRHRKSCGKTREAFKLKFPGRPVPSRRAILLIAKKFNETGCVTDREKNRRPHVLTEGKLDEIRAALERSPGKSLRQAAQETGISVASVRRATNFIKWETFPATTVKRVSAKLLFKERVR
ncbi:hypothetical protein C0J52_19459 [Blattella germanica]|nr:hypothetical protein C0J52_19459 [Blattella germanica]